MCGSRALKTTPIAPRPSSRRISYLPILFVVSPSCKWLAKADATALVLNCSGPSSPCTGHPRTSFHVHNQDSRIGLRDVQRRSKHSPDRTRNESPKEKAPRCCVLLSCNSESRNANLGGH